MSIKIYGFTLFITKFETAGQGTMVVEKKEFHPSNPNLSYNSVFFSCDNFFADYVIRQVSFKECSYRLLSRLILLIYDEYFTINWMTQFSFVTLQQ